MRSTWLITVERYEIFTTSGQCVLYSIHPTTGRPYQWPDASPVDLGPRDIPEIPQDRLDAFHAAAAPLCTPLSAKPRAGRANTTQAGYMGLRTRTSDRTSGHVALALAAVRANPDEDPIDLFIHDVATALPGMRYPRAFGAIGAAVMLGYSDSIIERLHDAYARLFTARDRPARMAAIRTWHSVIRQRHGPDDATIARTIGPISDEWHRRRHAPPRRKIIRR